MSFILSNITPVYSSDASLAPVVASVIPDTDNSYDLGTLASGYKDVYMKGSLYVNGKGTLRDNSQIELSANDYDLVVETTGTGVTTVTSAVRLDLGTTTKPVNAKGPLTSEEAFVTNGLTTLSTTGVNTRVKGTFQVDETSVFNDNITVNGTITPSTIVISTNTNELSITGSNGINADVAGEIALDTTDTTNGISIGETNDVPIGIGTGVTYPVIFNSPITASEVVTLSKGLTVNSNNVNLGPISGTGSSTVRNNFAVSGNSVLTGNLDVDGATTLDSTDIDTTGGSFGVSGTGTSLINTTGSNNLQSSTSIDIGTTSAIPVIVGNGSGSILLDGNTTIDGTVLVNNSASFTAQSVSMTLGTLGGTIGLLGTTTVSRPFTTNDTTVLNGTTVVDNTLNVSGLSTMTGGILTTGANDIDLVTTGALTLSGSTVTSNVLTNSGNMSIGGNLTMTGSITAPTANTFGKAGNTNTVNGSLDVIQNLDVTGTFDVTGISTMGATTVTDLTTNGTNTIAGSVDINASTYDLDATGAVTVDTTDATNGIKIGTSTAVPITIGNASATVTFPSNVSMNGITTIINSTISASEDLYILTNINEAGAGVGGDGLSGLQIERGTEANAVFQWNESTDSFEYGILGSLSTLSTSSLGTQNTNGVVYYNGTNAISGTDFTWNGTTMVVNNLTMAGNTITSSSGDVIITPTGNLDINSNIDMTTSSYDILVPDNSSTALEIKEGSNAYITIDTTDSSERVLVTPNAVFSGDVNITGTLTGGNIATSSNGVDARGTVTTTAKSGGLIHLSDDTYITSPHPSFQMDAGWPDETAISFPGRPPHRYLIDGMSGTELNGTHYEVAGTTDTTALTNLGVEANTTTSMNISLGTGGLSTSASYVGNTIYVKMSTTTYWNTFRPIETWEYIGTDSGDDVFRISWTEPTPEIPITASQWRMSETALPSLVYNDNNTEVSFKYVVHLPNTIPDTPANSILSTPSYTSDTPAYMNIRVGNVISDNITIDGNTISSSSGNVIISPTSAFEVTSDISTVIHSGTSDTPLILRNDTDTAGWDFKISTDNEIIMASSGNGDTLKLTQTGLVVGRTSSDNTCVIKGVAGSADKGLCVGVRDSGTAVNNVFNVHSDENNDATATFMHYGSASTQQYGVAIKTKALNTSASQYNLIIQNGGVTKHTFFMDGTCDGTGAYNNVSDAKLKENIVNCNPQLDKLMNINVKNYNFINNPQLNEIGVVAQELESTYPTLICNRKDLDEDNNDLGTITKSVKYSVFIPILIKALQEANQKIIDLTARVTDLES